MNNHVTSQPLSKRLKEAGVEQESLFYWIWVGHTFMPMMERELDGGDDEQYSAFLASELLDMLPAFNPSKDALPFQALTIRKNTNKLGDEYSAVYHNANRDTFGKPILFGKSLPEAAGEMMLWVIKNGYE